MSLVVTSLAAHPELEDTCWALTGLWPRFMLEAPIADLYFSDLASVAATAWMVTDGSETIARAFAVPVALGPDHDRPVLPGDGWDAVVRYGWLDRLAGRAPVRPSRKADEPDTPMVDHAARTRADGLPADPWLRTHVRAGGELRGVCPASMTVGAPLAAWRAWTGLPLERSGPAHVPGALVPVHVDVAQDHAVHVEPNVRVVHRC